MKIRGIRSFNICKVVKNIYKIFHDVKKFLNLQLMFEQMPIKVKH